MTVASSITTDSDFATSNQDPNLTFTRSTTASDQSDSPELLLQRQILLDSNASSHRITPEEETSTSTATPKCQDDPKKIINGLNRRNTLIIIALSVAIGTVGLLVQLYLEMPPAWKRADQVKGWRNLESAMKRELFGQHIVVEGVLNATYGHVRQFDPQKALVLCFHGTLGSGKTFVSQLIAKHLYHDVEGLGNSCTKSFIGPRHFLDRAKLSENQEKLSRIVEDTVRNCGRSVFVFDEVDKMPPEVFDVLLPFIDYHSEVDGIDYRRTIFIFLSNTGSTEINEEFIYYLIKNTKKRDQITMSDFRELIEIGAFNEKGGLFHSEMITKKLVDHYVPFLPLEREHIILCAKKEIQRRKVLYLNPEKIADRMRYSEGPIKLAEDGCKNVIKEVNVFVHDSDDAFK